MPRLYGLKSDRSALCLGSGPLLSPLRLQNLMCRPLSGGPGDHFFALLLDFLLAPRHRTSPLASPMVPMAAWTAQRTCRSDMGACPSLTSDFRYEEIIPSR